MAVCNNINFFDLSHLGYGLRVGVQKESAIVNPRRELGKLGISYHNKFTRLFHKTIPVMIKDSKGVLKEIYLNRKSAIKWINAQVGEINRCNDSTSDEYVLRKMGNIANIFSSNCDKKTHPLINTQSTTSVFNRIKGFLWSCYFNVTKSSWTLFKARFLIGLSEKTACSASQLLAIRAYKTAQQNIKAYKEFTKKQAQTFDAVPISSKDNYIKPAIQNDRELDLYNNGIIPPGSKNDTSTGTTGVPTQWYRGPEEQAVVEKLVSYSAKAILGDKPYYFINGFALGQWASGLTAFASMRNDPKATISSPGMDTEKIFEAIKHATQIVPKGHPIVVAGYPPHLREVVDKAIQEGFPLEDHYIIGVVGGEGMSEGQRDLIEKQANRTGFTRCFSTYGASDLDINIGYESDFEVELRKLCHENSALAKELFGHNHIPMIFHYDPFNYHIEHDEESNLLFTCVRGDRISARVRYNLGDMGRVISCSDLLAILQKHGVELKNPPRTNLPLLFVWGRGDNLISYRGANVAPENLGEAISRSGLKEAILHYGFFQYENQGETCSEIFLEFDPKTSPPSHLYTTLIRHMCEINPDFKKQYDEDKNPRDHLKIRLFDKGKSPMAKQRARYPHLKKKYIFKEKSGDEFTPNHKRLGGRIIMAQK